MKPVHGSVMHTIYMNVKYTQEKPVCILDVYDQLTLGKLKKFRNTDDIQKWHQH